MDFSNMTRINQTSLLSPTGLWQRLRGLWRLVLKNILGTTGAMELLSATQPRDSVTFMRGVTPLTSTPIPKQDDPTSLTQLAAYYSHLSSKEATMELSRLEEQYNAAWDADWYDLAFRITIQALIEIEDGFQNGMIDDNNADELADKWKTLGQDCHEFFELTVTGVAN